MLHVRICAGGRPQGRPLPRPPLLVLECGPLQDCSSPIQPPGATAEPRVAQAPRRRPRGKVVRSPSRVSQPRTGGPDLSILWTKHPNTISLPPSLPPVGCYVSTTAVLTPATRGRQAVAAPVLPLQPITT